MTPEYAFRTDDPVVLDAYRQAQQARLDAGHAMCDEAREIGKNNGPAIAGGIFGLGDEVIGLFADNPDDPPAGWTYRKGRGYLVPRPGKAGEPARAFLDRHKKIGADPRVALADHGLPFDSRVPMADGRYSLRKPVVFEHDGALYAKFSGDPRVDPLSGKDRGCTWPEIPLSQYYAALETVQAARKAQEAVA
jgi:hypothetical protein